MQTALFSFRPRSRAWQTLPSELAVACQRQQQESEISKRSLRRRLHTRKALPFTLENGCRPFLSAQALRSLAVDYQEGLLDRLNDCVRGGPLEHSSVVQTIIQTAQDRTQAVTFNYASEALNNAFFLSRLTPNPSKNPDKEEQRLFQDLENEFGSMIQFKTLFSAAAMGMSGSGYIWLVMDQKTPSQLGVIGTYGSGTVLVQNRAQRGDSEGLIAKIVEKQYSGTQETSAADSSAQDPTPAGDSAQKQQKTPKVQAYPGFYDQRRIAAAERSLSSFQLSGYQTPVRENPAPNKEFQLHPLLCVAVSERCWLPDYGIWGKQQYLTNFWESVDWTTVAKSYAKLSPAPRDEEPLSIKDLIRSEQSRFA